MDTDSSRASAATQLRYTAMYSAPSNTRRAPAAKLSDSPVGLTRFPVP